MEVILGIGRDPNCPPTFVGSAFNLHKVIVVTVDFSFEDSQTKKAVVLKEFYLYGISILLSTAPPL